MDMKGIILKFGAIYDAFRIYHIRAKDICCTRMAMTGESKDVNVGMIYSIH